MNNASQLDLLSPPGGESNSEVILTSERYTRKASALEGIAAVELNAALDARYDGRESSAKQPYFVLRANNNEVLGTSEMYVTARARDEGISAVKANARGASVDDRT